MATGALRKTLRTKQEQSSNLQEAHCEHSCSDPTCDCIAELVYKKFRCGKVVLHKDGDLSGLRSAITL